jgi:hypothetical protein
MPLSLKTTSLDALTSFVVIHALYSFRSTIRVGAVNRAAGLAVTMHSEAPLTLLLSPLRAGRGELERTLLGSLFGNPHAVPTEGSPLPFEKGEGQGEGSSQLHGYGLVRKFQGCPE